MSDRCKLLQEISEISFTVDDLQLYLDTHPKDTKALDLLCQNMGIRRQLMSRYAGEFGPLTLDSSFSPGGQRPFAWTDGPLPWEGGIL